MAALPAGVQYGLSSESSYKENKELVFVKLTDSALKAIEDFIRNNKDKLAKPKIQFLPGNEGGYERGGSPQPSHPSGAPSPGPGQSAPGALSPNQDAQHPPHPGQHLGHPPPHQGYPPPPRPGQPSTPNAHDPDTDLTGQNSNDSGGSGGAGRASTPHLRPTPSPTGSSGSRSMSPAVGTQNVQMPPRPSSSVSDGSGPITRPPGGPPGPPGPAPPPASMLPQPYPHHGYKPPHYPPQQYAYPPRNPHPYPYAGYRPPPPPQHYPPIKSPRHMGPPGSMEGAMPPPTAPGDPHDNGPATALVTTGPDGAPLDEGSQQSTLSNASAASGEECPTPKGRKDGYGPGSSAPSPSPGGGSHSSAHDDYDASPSSWQRPPSSPKSDSLGKLYEMDESPERRGWVERLLAFMEERRTPIAACPTISKQPLDLYRLYLLVRERGGFVEVTKNKTWKDIAGLLGIGASSSAAYTLRKHYTKNLLAYECHFDRGGIDPQPIINQVEASTKKKSNKANNNSSPGPNAQESFPPASGAPGPSMDGYGGSYTGYPPQPNQPQGPSSDNLAASNPFDEPPGPRRPPGYQQGYGYDYGSPYPPNRQPYPPYGPEGDRGYNAGNAGGEYRYGGAPNASGAPQNYPYRPPAPPPAAPPAPSQSYADYYRNSPPNHAPPPHQPPHAPPPPPHHEISGGSSPVNLLGSQLARQLVAPLPSKPFHFPGGKGAPPANAPPPSSASPPAPRRHPDFGGKEGWFRGGAWRPPPPTAPQYHPYRHMNSQNHTQGQPPASWAGAPGPRPAAEVYPPAAAASPAPGTVVSRIGKQELTFPPDCVESAVPSAEKRRRLTKADVAPVDAWRIMMALKSGLLAETCWALDILNILLYDDSCIGYFGLQHLPGLLDLLLQHFHRSISEVFDEPQEDDRPWYEPVPIKNNTKECEPPKAKEKMNMSGDKTVVLRGENFTKESRRRMPVVFKDDELFAPEEEDKQERSMEHDALEPWQVGELALPLPPFPAVDVVHVPFVKRMKGRSRRISIPAPKEEPPSPRQEDDLRTEPMEIEGDKRVTLEVRDPAGVLKRRNIDDYEDECYSRDEPSLNLVSEAKEALASRCLALSNILRGLTFVPGNESEFSRSGAFLALAGRLLLLHHEHAPRAHRQYASSCESHAEGSVLGDKEWWWDTLERLREDALVACANIAGGVELSSQPEAVARPLLDGLLHWAVCGAAVANDAPAHAPAHSPLSPRRLALEALCKLCVSDANVDLVLATPPRARVGALCASLARDLCRPERPVVREFAVNLLHYLAGAGSGAAREVALHAPAVSQLLAFIERAEQAALGVANQLGVAALRDNPDAMGTSLDMLRRAAATLARLARHPANRPLLRRHERRLLSLVMSQILDQKVAQELADVLYQCSRASPTAVDETLCT